MQKILELFLTWKKRKEAGDPAGNVWEWFRNINSGSQGSDGYMQTAVYSDALYQQMTEWQTPDVASAAGGDGRFAADPRRS